MIVLAVLSLLCGDARAAAAPRAVQVSVVPVAGLLPFPSAPGTVLTPADASFRVSPAALIPSLAAPSLAPVPLPEAAAFPAMEAAAVLPALDPAAEPLEPPGPDAVPAVWTGLFDGTQAPAASVPLDSAPEAEAASLGRLSAGGAAAFDRYAQDGLDSVPKEDGREDWSRKKLGDYRTLLTELSALLPKDAVFIYPFMGPDALPALARPTLPIEYDRDDFRRGRAMAGEFLGLDVSALDRNLLANEPFDVRRLEDYVGKVEALTGPRVLILKDFWRYSQNHPDLLGRLTDRLLRPGDMVLVLRSGDIRLMQDSPGSGLAPAGPVRTVPDPGDWLWTEHPLMDLKVLTLPTAFGLWVKKPAKFILRFSGGAKAPEADVERVRRAPGVRIVESTDRMLLVEGPESVVRELADGLQGWKLSAYRTVGMPEEPPGLDELRKLPGVAEVRLDVNGLLVFVCFRDRPSHAAAKRKGLLPRKLGRFNVKYTVLSG